MTPEDFYGGSTFLVIGTSLLMRAKPRLWVISPTTGSLVATLPDAREFNSTGGEVFFITNGSGTDSLEIRDGAGVLIDTLATQESCWIGNTDITTNAGGYFSHHNFPSFGLGSFIPIARELFRIRFTEDENDVNLRLKLATEFGYTGINPVRIHCSVENGAVIGSTDTAGETGGNGGAGPSLTTGALFPLADRSLQVFPAGSMMYLHVKPGSALLAAGGAGGDSGNWAAPFGQRGAVAGQPGGTALGMTIPVLLNNEGLIAGGGGGGGGAGYIDGVENGGGGGGGAGRVGGAGGNIGAGGVSGQDFASGGGGIPVNPAAGEGGRGGVLGQAGEVGEAGTSASGNNGGPAGDFIQFTAGSTLSLIKVGSVVGGITQV